MGAMATSWLTLVLVLMVMSTQSSSKKVGVKTVPPLVKRLLENQKCSYKLSNGEPVNNCTSNNPEKEFIFTTSKKSASDVEVPVFSSKVANGLDCDLTFTVGKNKRGPNQFKKRLKVIFPGVDRLLPPFVKCFAGDKKHCTFQAFKEDLINKCTLHPPDNDFIRIVANKARNDEVTIPLVISHITNGLDCDKTFTIAGNRELDGFKDMLRLIFPGTKWCGDGNISTSFEDLGLFKYTDSCCRQHDHCPVSIAAGESAFGLENTGLFTRSHCSCDARFHYCLKRSNTVISKSIGYTYFTVLAPQCFKKAHKIIDCLHMKCSRCVKYRVDKSSVQSYQWFDTPPF